ncbi:PREDICTED: serine/threonine-protein kinase sel-5 [Ipomoea nil]|uniref:serine/threonine-protein kinase sel-5 n=1 Tax=Ipomoea nil TaxID=35883 RepID=UPI0009014643|nr:PREDICTED: serine/threonine-protein kinase sel-5 [Ipomoea nil]
MGFGAIRSVARPVSRALFSYRNIFAVSSPSTFPSLSPELRLLFRPKLPWIPPSTAFHSLTDTRYPKRRPSLKSRRKRPIPKPPGLYVVAKRLPHDPKPPKNPNEGSLKRRNEKKRIKQRKAFIVSEKKKRKALVQEAKKKKLIKRVERKMAAVARERAWAERLAELQKLEEEKKAVVMA